MFDAGPQFVFNMGGGPGIRVHQFGGGRPRRRPREPGVEEPQPTLRSTIAGLLPLLILFIVPLLSSLFGGSDSLPAGPQIRLNGPEPPYELRRTTRDHHIDYWVNPAEVADFSARKFNQLDQRAEATLVRHLKIDCEREVNRKQQIVNEAQGWFFQDPEKIMQARKLPMKACRRLEQLGQVPRGSY